jgi:mannose-1-phosphate guanylyltransferase
MARVEDSEMPFVSKDWGYEQWLANNEKYCGKLLFIKSGKHGSYHMHPKKDEVMHVLEGMLHLVIEEDGEPTFYVVRVGGSFRIPPGTPHQLSAPVDTKIIEVSTPHSDDDVVRITKEKVET